MEMLPVEGTWHSFGGRYGCRLEVTTLVLLGIEAETLHELDAVFEVTVHVEVALTPGDGF